MKYLNGILWAIKIVLIWSAIMIVIIYIKAIIE